MVECDQNIRELLQRSILAGSAPAGVAAWGRRGEEIRVESLGFATLFPERAEVSRETWFDLASLTKPLVTTTLTLLAFRSGVAAPTTQVGEVLDEVSCTDVGNLEVKHLLTHTAGLPGWLPLYCLAENRLHFLASILGEIQLEGRPGEKVVYSCIGFVILGLMLERLADDSLDSLFQREVLKVTGLEGDLSFKADPATHSLAGGSAQSAVEKKLVRNLGFDQQRLPPTGYGLPDDGNARFLRGVAGNAGLFGTARGVVALASEYLPGGGLLLSSAEAAEATTLRTEGLEQGRGWGWQLASTPGCSAGRGLSVRAFGHTGFTGASVWCDPERNNGYALLTNRNHPAQRGNDLHPLRRAFHRLVGRAAPA